MDIKSSVTNPKISKRLSEAIPQKSALYWRKTGDDSFVLSEMKGMLGSAEYISAFFAHELLEWFSSRTSLFDINISFKNERYYLGLIDHNKNNVLLEEEIDFISDDKLADALGKLMIFCISNNLI